MRMLPFSTFFIFIFFLPAEWVGPLCPLATGSNGGGGLGVFGGCQLLRLLRLLRVPRLMKFNRVWQSVQTKYAINYSDLQLFGFCAMICIFCHWLACGW